MASTWEKIQVVVLMGGLGTRLKEISSHIPKTMVDIYGKPFFYYQLRLMKWQGLKNFIFCIGYRGEAIKSFFSDGHNLGVNIKYSYDGKKLFGTGGALRSALLLLKKDFILIYGDTYMDIDYSELLYAYHKVLREENKKGLMAVFKNKNRYDKSNVLFQNNRLLKYDKKNNSADMEYIDYGTSILNRSVIEKTPKNKYVDLADIYKDLIRCNLMSGYEVRNRFYDIGTPSSLNEFKKFIYQKSILEKPAVFLDRDGTLNALHFNDNTQQLDSPLNPQELKLLPKTISSLRILKSLGYILIVITNQPAAAKGKTTLGRLYEVNNRFKDVLAEKNIYFDDIFICPHHPIGSPYTKEPFLIKKCKCRKPKPHFLNIAIKKFNIDRANSYVVGDSYTDIVMAKAAKIKSVFLGQYKCDTCKFLKYHKPDYIFSSLYDLVLYLKKVKREKCSTK